MTFQQNWSRAAETATRHVNDQYCTPGLGLIVQKRGANSHCVKNREGQSALPSRIGVITARFRRAGATSHRDIACNFAESLRANGTKSRCKTQRA
jgi:hypothetical protein